jgi:sugar O-acyltransferase (sialic acid O-acetyltransferase NeuD family)
MERELMKRIVIIGAGGHGREVADILKGQNQTEVVGFIDENRELHGSDFDGWPVLGDWSWFDDPRRLEIAVVCAVGLPQLRRRLTKRAESLGLSFVNAISHLALISPSAKLGEGVTVFPHGVINAGAVVESHSILNVAATVSHDTKIGRYSTVNPGAHIGGNVSIGEGCYLGIGSNVIHGQSIGEWSVVGAGAVVTTDLPANVTAVGVPARIIKRREEGWYDR